MGFADDSGRESWVHGLQNSRRVRKVHGTECPLFWLKWDAEVGAEGVAVEATKEAGALRPVQVVGEPARGSEMAQGLDFEWCEGHTGAEVGFVELPLALVCGDARCRGDLKMGRCAVGPLDGEGFGVGALEGRAPYWASGWATRPQGWC